MGSSTCPDCEFLIGYYGDTMEDDYCYPENCVGESCRDGGMYLIGAIEGDLWTDDAVRNERGEEAAWCVYRVLFAAIEPAQEAEAATE